MLRVLSSYGAGAAHPAGDLRKSLLLRSFFLVALGLTTCVSIRAQAPAAGSDWGHMKALPANTRLHVSGDKVSHTCNLVSVDDTSLVCGRYTFARAEVKKVKLTRYGVSYGVGAAIGAGAGAGVGVALVSGDSLFSNDKGKAAGIGVLVGGAFGALVAGPADLFRGPTVYRRQ